MAINFPSPAVNGQTYQYLGVTYQYSQQGMDEGYWKVALPTTSGIATPAEIDTGTDNVKYITPEGMAQSKYGTGATGSFTTNDGKTVTVQDGLITNIA